MSQNNGHAPRVIANVTIQLIDNGAVVSNANAPDMNIVFHMLGAATSQYAQKAAEMKAQSVEVAPAGLVNRLLNQG